MTKPHPSRSDVQQEIEKLVRDRLGKQLEGVRYSEEKIPCGDEYVKVDAVGRDPDGKIVDLVDIYAHQGKLKGGQLKKPTDDAARLMLAAKHLDSNPRLRLVWCCEDAVGQVQRGWRGSALQAMGVEIEAISLTKPQKARIAEAQVRQKR